MMSIHLLPLGSANRELVEGLVSPLQVTFRSGVHTREHTLDLEQFYDEQRAQYNSTQILLSLKSQYEGIASDDDTKTLAIVPHDLFIPILTYVFGEAEVGGNVAVVSYYRLDPERYGLPSDRKVLSGRFLKEVVHELGHAHSLVHCATHSCVMHSSSYVEDIDLKGESFCIPCSRALGLAP